MKRNIKFLSILLLFIVLTMGAVSAENSAAVDDGSTLFQSSDYGVTESNHNDFSDGNGNLNDNVADSNTSNSNGNLSGSDVKIKSNTLNANKASGANIVNATFFDYFDESGMLLSNVTDKTLIFSGEFSGLGISSISIVDSINLVSNNAVLVDIAISIAGDNVSVDGFTFRSTTLENAVEVYGNNVAIKNNKFIYSLVQGKDNTLIYANGISNLTVKNNTISFKGENTGSTINGVINLEDVDDSLVADNKIDAEIPSAATVYGPAPDYKAKYAAYVIQATGNKNVITNNDLSLKYTSILGSYDSLYAIVVGGSDSVVSKNTVKGTGNRYIYGITASGSNVNLTGNDIKVLSSGYSANGISLNAPYNGVISNNVVNLTAKSVVYGTNDYGSIHALYKGNKFILNSNSVYGMELMGVDETAVDNEIIAKGNYTMAVAVFIMDGEANVSNNKINVNGYGLGTPTTGDTIPSMNVAIYVAGSADAATVSGNRITAVIPSCSWDKQSEAIYATFEDAVISGNDINVSPSNRVGDYDSIYGVKLKGDGISFKNNNITLKGVNYSYGLHASGEGIKIDSNNINVINKNNHGVGIEMDCPFKGTATNNVVNVDCKESAYGIYSSQWGSDTVEGNYTGNNVTVNGKTAYAFELIGENEIVSNNNIVANGQYTMGIATNSKKVTITDNRIRSNGAGKTNATTVDMFGATNQGVLLYNGDVEGTILRNNITTTGSYAVDVLKSENSKTAVKNNYLIGVAAVGDGSVHNITGTVADNTPDKGAVSQDVVKYYKNATQYTVKVVDSQGNPISGQKVVVTLDGKSFKNLKYTITTKADGVATLAINLVPGLYNVTANYDGQILKNTITVLPVTYGLSAENINMIYKDGTKYTVKVTDPQGNPVVGQKVAITINSPKWSKSTTYNVATDSSGVASLAIGLAVGQYTFTAKYEAEAITTKVNVLSEPIVMEVEDVVKYYKNGTQYSVMVKDLDGNPIANKNVNVTLMSSKWSKPVTYNLVTNAQGIATLAINLGAGQYSATATVGSNIATSSIRVIPTLTAENLVKPTNQPANLVAKLVDGHGKPVAGKKVTFTVKTKTYTKVTDANGLASLPINLGVGTWSINIADPQTGAKTTAKVTVTKAKP